MQIERILLNSGLYKNNKAQKNHPKMVFLSVMFILQSAFRMPIDLAE